MRSFKVEKYSKKMEEYYSRVVQASEEKLTGYNQSP